MELTIKLEIRNVLHLILCALTSCVNTLNGVSMSESWGWSLSVAGSNHLDKGFGDCLEP